jgi:hypothetical protein
VGEFWLIIGIGHCGSKWLAMLLDSMEGIQAHHELKTSLSRMSWPTWLAYEGKVGPAGERYDPYWRFIEQERQHCDILVDSNSWVPTGIPDAKEYDIDRVIYIIRNGIPHLESLSRHSWMWSSAPLEHYALDTYLRGYWELLGAPNPPWSKWTRWERLCAMWAGSAMLPIVNDYLPDTYHFEGLTRGSALLDLIPSITNDEIRRWQQRDINRKTQKSRDPADVWQRWTPKQRKAFVRICGEPMDIYGYEIPD